MRLGDTNPSVIFGCYTRPKKYEELLKAIEERGLSVRELKFIDVEIPLDESYDENINWFKSFIKRDYWAGRNPLFKEFKFMGVDVKEKLLGQLRKQGYDMVDFSSTDWENHKQHELLLSLAVPLFVQDQSQYCETKTEKENMKRLLKFESEGYTDDEENDIKKLMEKIEDESKE